MDLGDEVRVRVLGDSKADTRLAGVGLNSQLRRAHGRKALIGPWCGGQGVSVLAFYSDVPSSNLAGI